MIGIINVKNPHVGKICSVSYQNPFDGIICSKCLEIHKDLLQSSSHFEKNDEMSLFQLPS